jgi:hypothetical protein
MATADRMSEAEVSLRVAFYLLDSDLAASVVDVAIDGAQVRTGEAIHFSIAEFIAQNACTPDTLLSSWQGTYCRAGARFRVRIHSTPGKGDVVALLSSGHTLRVESKKGPLERSPSSAEYPLLREAIGQLMTVETVGENDILAVAVPKSAKFTALAARWRRAPLIRRLGIRLLTVDRENKVEGFAESVT